MLMDLLEKMRQGGVQRPADLAAELGVSSSLVEQMLLDLERLGYLQSIAGGCSPASCAHCGATCPLPVQNGGQGWALTPRGARALGR